MKKRANELGFTLMELMVVIVIVAILAAVAVPLYINYVKDARRTEAKGAVAAVVSAEQVYFQQYNTYTTDMTLLKVDLNDVTRNWTVTVPAAGATGFSVNASGTSTGDAKGLAVCCVYSQSATPQWTDAACTSGP